jgi:hypothetical protein
VAEVLPAAFCRCRLLARRLRTSEAELLRWPEEVGTPSHLSSTYPKRGVAGTGECVSEYNPARLQRQVQSQVYACVLNQLPCTCSTARSAWSRIACAAAGRCLIVIVSPPICGRRWLLQSSNSSVPASKCERRPDTDEITAFQNIPIGGACTLQGW